MKINLKENERIDDLERNGYRIIQNKSRFCFGMDAVLLSGFALEGEKLRGLEKKNKLPQVVDLGTGTGIIPILLHAKLGYKNAEKSDLKAEHKLYGLEIQPEVCDMAQRSVLLNDLQDDISIVLGDIKEASSVLGKGKFDIVTSNPPYMKNAGGLTNPDESKAISRHEILCSFDDVAREARALLKSGGRFYMVHRPQRLAELIAVLKANKLEPKRMRLVHSFIDAEATMVLIEAVNSGGSFMQVEKPLIIYKEKGQYTDEILEIYNF